jgi:hypothetical protein
MLKIQKLLNNKVLNNKVQIKIKNNTSNTPKLKNVGEIVNQCFQLS